MGVLTMLKGSAQGPAAPKARASRSWLRSLEGKLLIPTFAALFFIATFCALGFWQLQRAAEKRALQDEYDQRSLQAPVPLTSELRSAESLQFFRVEVRGSYETDRQLLLDNRSYRGAPGYHVITPLRIGGGETRVLVNRGWVPLGADRAHLPPTDVPREEVTLSGVAVVPRVGFQLGSLDPLRRGSPTVWQQMDLARYAAETGVALQPIVILLDPSIPVGGYVRDWVRLDAGIAVHQGYAFQWFALAATVVVLYAVLALRTRWRRKRM